MIPSNVFSLTLKTSATLPPIGYNILNTQKKNPRNTSVRKKSNIISTQMYH